MRIPRLLQAVLVIAGVYVLLRIVFDGIVGQPIPASLMTMYMFFIVVGVLMVFTFTEQGAAEMAASIRALVEDPSRRGVRNVVFVIVPLAAAAFTYTSLLPSLEAPVELRTIHPTPPASATIFDERFDVLEAENPFRELETEDPEEFRVAVAEGAEVYIVNCMFCHGDKLDGRGPYAAGLNPLPMNFQDVGTIAQLQESYLFWRISTGGPGLPAEAAPWTSSMPVWQNFLTADEIWKVILFLYDYTGHRPRSFEE